MNFCCVYYGNKYDVKICSSIIQHDTKTFNNAS